MDVEFSLNDKSCQDLFKKSSNQWIKKSELDNHDFFSLEGLQLTGLSALALGPASWTPSILKKSWLSSSEFFYPDITLLFE